MTAATIVADFSGPDLVPGLVYIQHQAVLIDGLRGKRHIGWNLGQEASVRVIVCIQNGIALAVIFSEGNLSQNTQAFIGVVGIRPCYCWTIAQMTGRLHSENSRSVNITVAVSASVCTLRAPIRASIKDCLISSKPRTLLSPSPTKI